MESQQDRLYHLALSMIKNIGGFRARQLVSYCGSAQAVLEESKKNLLKIPGISTKIVGSIKDSDCFHKAEKELAFIEKHEIQLMYYLDNNYPSRLKNFDDAPVCLFYKGTADLNKDKHISIVGTRTPSERGGLICSRILEGLKMTDANIISGLAHGVDTYAHKYSLEQGLDTISVVAHGLDMIYPKSNMRLAGQIVENGGLLTEFPSRTIPDKERFPARNRIIAALCDALIVIESAESGGSMITANFANEYNKDVFAVPGRVNDLKSRGCNKLIKEHKAHLLENAQDLIQLMQWDQSNKTLVQKSLFFNLTEEESMAIDLIRDGKNTVDEIIEGTGYTAASVSAILLNLEFKGVLKSLPGKKYLILE